MNASRSARPIRIVYTLALAGATFNHARAVLAHGLAWDYGGLPAYVTHFWTALTFLDPLALLLLWLAPRAGLALTAAIIVCDVLVNAGVGTASGRRMASTGRRSQPSACSWCSSWARCGRCGAHMPWPVGIDEFLTTMQVLCSVFRNPFLVHTPC
jgi:hypothetical protein